VTGDSDRPGERALSLLDEGGPWRDALDMLLGARGREPALRDAAQVVSGAALRDIVAPTEVDGDGDHRAPAIELANTVDALTNFLAAARREPVAVLLPAGVPAWERDRLLGALDAVELPVDVPGVVFATSGTTGAPKLVFRAWRSLLANAVSLARTGGFTTADTMLAGTPLQHAYGFTVALLGALAGGAELLLGPLPLTPDAWARGIAGGATVVQSVPAMYRWLASSPGGVGAGTGRLRMAVVAGEAVDPGLVRSWRDATAVPLVVNYGTTETGPITLDVDQVDGSVGRPLPGVEVRVEAHERGGASHEGELVVRTQPPGPCYLSRDVGITADGWFHTGDLGELDARGAIRLAGRVDERVNIEGNKVDVVEVEAALLEHPAIRECAVAARRQGGGPPRLWAFVVAGGDVSVADLRRHLAGRLSPHKIPATFRTLPALPRTASGKLRRSQLPS